MRFSCTTRFDITATGVTGHYKSSRVPFADRAGHQINNMVDWNRSRNQQRNWETVNQIISMRTQISQATEPACQESTWYFEFETETPGVYGDDLDPVAILRTDADGVPMLVDLDNDQDLSPFIVVAGPEQNIWFSPVSINK